MRKMSVLLLPLVVLVLLCLTLCRSVWIFAADECASPSACGVGIDVLDPMYVCLDLCGR